MNRSLLVITIALFCAPLPTHAQQSDPLAALAWLGGCWESRAGARVVSEMWMPPSGGFMVGGARTLVGGAPRAYEHLRLRATDGKVVYTAVPSGQRETEFTASAVTADSLVIGNPQHDFPQRIVYRRVSADSMVARVEGPGPGGRSRGFDSAYRRVRCEGTPAL